MRLLLVPLLAACAPVPPALDRVTLADFAYIGPGSMGRFTDYARHPTHPDVLLAGADVGGVYLSADAGASWQNVGENLPTNGVWGVGFSVEQGEIETTRIVLGTDAGLFHSALVDTSAGLDPADFIRWTEGEGLERGVDRPDDDISRALSTFSGNVKSMPIGVIEVDPSDPSRVWAGITATGQMNLAQDPKDPYSLQRLDKWKVFRSLDGGVSWEPALRFSAPIDAFVAPGFDSDGSVFDILVDPSDSGRVWVTSDRGLYLSEDADTAEDADGDGLPDLHWTELGTPSRRASADLGMSWTDTDAACAPWAEGSADPAWCLPIIDTATVELVLDPVTGWPQLGVETHPNLRSLASTVMGDTTRLYVTVWDRGHADDAHASCSRAVDADGFKDANLEYLRGGVYRSDDGGETWTWTLTDTGAPGADPASTALITDLRYRCDARTSERNSDGDISFFPDVDAPATSTADTLLVGVLGTKSGLWGYDGAAWTFLTNQRDSDFKSRFEGGAPLNITGGSKVEVSRLLVDRDDPSETHPDVWFSARGVLHGAWNSTSGWYQFEHLGSDYAGTLGDLPAWSGTGLDDAVVWDVVEVGDVLYAGVSDGGLFRAERVDGAWAYTNYGTNTFTPNWSTSPDDLKTDECHALAYDAESNTLFATNGVTATGYTYSVLASDGSTWSVIGGYGYPSDPAEAETVDDAHMNGLYTGSPLESMDLNDLLAVPPSLGASLDLLAATSDGVWGWDREGAAGSQWAPLCDDLGDGHNFPAVNADFDLVPGYAFAVSDSRSQRGLLAIDLATGACAALQTRLLEVDGVSTSGVDPVFEPASVALAEDEDGGVRLIVGVHHDGYVSLLSGDLSCAAGCAVGGWTQVWTGEGVYDDGPRDPIMKRFDVLSIAVDPGDKRVVLAGLGTKPGYDYYNPQHVLVSEDGGRSVVPVDLEATATGLPNRNVHTLEFSEDGRTLYAGTRSSLFAMPVTW